MVFWSISNNAWRITKRLLKNKNPPWIVFRGQGGSGVHGVKMDNSIIPFGLGQSNIKRGLLEGVLSPVMQFLECSQKLHVVE